MTSQLLEAGRALHQAGNLVEAEATYRRVLQSEPHNIQALHLLWAALSQQGSFAAALEVIELAVRHWSNDAVLWHSLGTALTNVARNGEAEEAFRRAVRIRPDFALGHFSLGFLLERSGRFREAEPFLREAARLAPDNDDVHNHLGLALLRLEQPLQAAACFRRAIAVNPNAQHAHSNLGSALRLLGELDAAASSSRRALALNPGLAPAHMTLGQALGELGRPEEALDHHREAVRLEPGNPVAHSTLGVALMRAGRPGEAQHAFRRAVELQPAFHDAHSGLIFSLDLLETSDVRSQQAERRRWHEQHAARHGADAKPHRNSPDPERRLRIGYVSADFRNHSAYWAFAPVLVGHDRAAFEVFCYSGTLREDDETARLRGAAHGWRSTRGVSDDELAEQVRSDGVDILVDLSGHSAGNRLLAFARKPAPVQVTAWGHATGTGLKAMDYLFADPVLVPREDRELYAEEIVDLPCAVCYEPPRYMPEVSAPPSLRGEPFTFGCVNRLEKITDKIIALWGRILADAPDARLLIKDRVLDDARLKQAFLDRLRGAGGIPAERLVLLGGSPHPAHVAVFDRIDIGLDPFPQGGGISSLEALYMGMPVITLQGATVPSRITSTILIATQMDDWVARTGDDYVRIALQKKRDLDALATLRQQLRTRFRRSAYGDLQSYVRAVDEAYRTMWRRWCERATSGRAV